MKHDNQEDKLMKNLADAIQKTLKSSKVVRKAIEDIEDQGHTCMLSFSAALVLNSADFDIDPTEDDDNPDAEIEETIVFDEDDDDDVDNKDENFDFSEEDINFLKSIKIRFP
jgi:hypothetical protein